MNVLRILLYVFFFGGSLAMADDSVVKPKPVKNVRRFVEFLGGFDGEKARLYVDNTLILSERLYTDGSIVVAKTLEIKSKKQTSNLEVQVSAWRPKKKKAEVRNEANEAFRKSFGIKLLPGPKAHGKLRQNVNIDWSKGFLVDFMIYDGELVMRQYKEWPKERY